MHDEDLDRTTNLTGAVKEKTLTELQAANLAVKFARNPDSPEKGCVQKECVPTLEAVIQWSVDNHVRQLFDVKDCSNEMVAVILQDFEQYDLYRRAIVCSFLPWVVYKVKRSNPSILTGLTWRRHFFSYSDLDGHKPRYKGLKQLAAVLIDRFYCFALLTFLPLFLGVDLLFTHVNEISPSLLAAQRAKGLQVAVWTVNDLLQASWIIDYLGLPILTDFPFISEQLKCLRKFVRDGCK